MKVMRVKFLKNTDDLRPNSGTFSKGDVRSILEEHAKIYIDKGHAEDEAGKYVKKKKLKRHGEE